MSEFAVTRPETQSPLSHRKSIGNAETSLGMAEVPFVTKITLRGEHAKIAQQIQSQLGLDLPGSSGAFTEHGDIRTVWLAPDEWLILAPDGEQGAILGALEAGLGETHHQAVDVSDYDTIIELNGSNAVDALSRLSTLDLHGDALPEGHATRTRLSKATVTLLRHRSNGTARSGYQILIRASMADYLWCLLAEAGCEYGLPAQHARQGELRRY